MNPLSPFQLNDLNNSLNIPHGKVFRKAALVRVLFIFLILLVFTEGGLAQTTVESSYILVGRNEKPGNGENVTDTLILLEASKGALAGGILFNSTDWSPDSLGFASFSYGFNSIASGERGSISLGDQTEAKGDFGSVALGRGSKAYGSRGASAIGYQSEALGDYGAVALGYQSKALNSDGTVAIGSNSEAFGRRSVAIGYNAKSYGDFGATSIGFATVAHGDNSVVVGRYNDTMVVKGADITDDSPLFIVGNGENGNNRSNAMVVRKDGLTSLYGGLDVEGSIRTNRTMEVSAEEDTTSVYIGKRIAENSNMPDLMGFRNSILGSLAGKALTDGSKNTFVGQLVGENTTDGSGNSFFGTNAGQFNISGSENCIYGLGAGLSNNGDRNAYFGADAGQNNNTGSNNSFFGEDAGKIGTTTMQSTFLGANADQKDVGEALDKAIAIGFNAKVDCDNCAVIGGTGADAVFVGIGVDSPHTHLTLLGSESNSVADMAITSQDALIELGIGQEGPHGFAFGDETMGEGMKLVYRSTPNELRVESGVAFLNNPATPLFALQDNGDLTIAGNLTELSDRRLKKDIILLKNASEALDQINGYSYHWRESYRSQKEQIGLIAQEVEKVFPQLVKKGTGGYLSVDYNSLIPVLIEAWKEERMEKERMKDDMVEIRKEIEELTALMHKMQK